MLTTDPLLAVFPILARGDEDSFVKILFGVVFVAIWVISAVVSAMTKQKEQARQQEAERAAGRDEFAEGLGLARTGAPSEVEARPVPPPPPPPLLREIAYRPPAEPAPPVQAPSKSARRRKKGGPRVPPPPPAFATRVPQADATLPPLPSTSALARGEIGSAGERGGAGSARGSVGAAAVARLLRPETLRTQFILTELLQPPLALREPREQGDTPGGRVLPPGAG